MGFGTEGVGVELRLWSFHLPVWGVGVTLRL